MANGPFLSGMAASRAPGGALAWVRRRRIRWCVASQTGRVSPRGLHGFVFGPAQQAHLACTTLHHARWATPRWCPCHGFQHVGLAKRPSAQPYCSNQPLANSVSASKLPVAGRQVVGDFAVDEDQRCRRTRTGVPSWFSTCVLAVNCGHAGPMAALAKLDWRDGASAAAPPIMASSASGKCSCNCRRWNRGG